MLNISIVCHSLVLSLSPSLAGNGKKTLKLFRQVSILSVPKELYAASELGVHTVPHILVFA